jgi:hypothetical protein
VRDALTFSVLWTMALGFVAGLPLTVALAYSAVCGGVPARERRARELYRILLEEEMYGEQCFSCRAQVEPDWLRCPSCTTELRGRCHGCDATIKLHWSACPWCAESLQSLPEPEHVPVRDLAPAPRPVDRRVEHIGAAAA